MNFKCANMQIPFSYLRKVLQKKVKHTNKQTLNLIKCKLWDKNQNCQNLKA